MSDLADTWCSKAEWENGFCEVVGAGHRMLRGSVSGIYPLYCRSDFLNLNVYQNAWKWRGPSAVMEVCAYLGSWSRTWPYQIVILPYGIA